MKTVVKATEVQSTRTVIFPETRRGSCFTRGQSPQEYYDVDFPQASFSQEDPVIDSSILHLTGKFPDGHPMLVAMKEFIDDLAITMVGLRNAVKASDHKWTNKAAQEVSEYALKVGAVRVLKLCFDLQASALRGDARHAETLAQQIEAEYKKAKEALIGYI